MNKTYFTKRELCPVCSSSNSNLLYSLDYSDSNLKDYLDSFYLPQGGVEHEYLENAKYTLVECQDCRLIYQFEIPDDFLMNKLYEEWINPEKVFEIYEKNYSVDYYTATANFIYKVITYFNKRPDQLKFFDFGMGWGRWCLMAQAFDVDSYGTELSESRIKYARSRGVKVISWQEIANHQFDFINMGDVCEHIPEPLVTIKYLKKSLKSGGLIKITVPNGFDLKKRLKIMDWKSAKGSKNSLNAVAPLEHINCFTYYSLIKMAELAQLKLIKMPVFPKLQVIKRLGYIPPSLIKQLVKQAINYKNTDLFFRAE